MVAISSQYSFGADKAVQINQAAAVVERLRALHYGVDFVFLSFDIMDFIVVL